MTYHSFLIFILCLPYGTEQWVLNSRVHNLVGEIYLFFIIPLALVIFGMQRVFHFHLTHLVSVQFSCSVMSDSVTPWTAALQASLSITNSRSLLKLVSIELVMPSNHVILCRSLPLLPSIFPSIRVFSSESVLHIRWPKYCSFSFSISPSNEYSEVISFRINWFDLFAVQKTLKSLLQHYSSKAPILQHSALFIVQLSHLYMTTGKNHSFD